MRFPLFTFVVVAATLASIAGAQAQGQVAGQVAGQGLRINTGGETGAYHRDFCPLLARELTTLGTPYTCAASSGTRENMERVRTSARDIGYGQLDVFTLESGKLSMGSALQIVRQDDVRECVFAVTRNRDVNSYGELAAYAPSLRVFLPPQASGSAGTFEFLRGIDPNGLGRANKPTYSGSTDEAIRAALQRDEGVAFFVQVPDDTNERFKLVRDLGGHFVPVLDRTILSQQIGGMNVYFGQDTRIMNGKLLEGGTRVTTACTPMVVFTGAGDRIRDTSERRQHQELVTGLKILSLDTVLPRQSPLRTAMQRTRELSIEGRDRFMAYSNRARDRALPFIDRMIERAAPRLPLKNSDTAQFQ
jgi:hypothetical protein